METINLKNGLFAVALGGLLAAGSVHAQSGDVARLAAGDDVASFEMYWPERDTAQVAARTATLAQLMLGEKVDASKVATGLTLKEDTRRASARHLSGAEALSFVYFADFDEIRLSNEELLHTTDETKDIGELAAVEVAADTLKRLAAAGIIDADDFDPARAQVGYRKVGGGNMDGSEAFERIIEYRVTYRRILNGIEMANSGLRIGVHAEGAISSLRVGGVSVNRDKRGAMSMPAGRGSVKARSVSRDEIEARFDASRPANVETRLAYSKLMYVMPEDVRSAVVAPSEVFSFSEAHASDDGETAVSRRQVVGYDVTDSKAAVQVFTVATQKASQEPVRTK